MPMMPNQPVIPGQMSPTPGAGRGMVNPQPVNVSDEDYVSPSDIYEMDKQRKEDRDMRQAEKAYSKSMTSMKKGGNVSTASKRADGIAQKGKTKGKYL